MITKMMLSSNQDNDDNIVSDDDVDEIQVSLTAQTAVSM